MPNMPYRPKKKDLIAQPHKTSLGQPSLENLFPRTLGMAQSTREEVGDATARGATGEALGKGTRGALAGGLIAFPADVAEGVGKVVPEPVKDWATGRGAVNFARGLFGGTTPPTDVPTTPAVPATPAAAPIEGIVQPPARQLSRRDQVRNQLMGLTQPGGTVAGGAGPAGGFENTAVAAGQIMRPGAGGSLAIPDHTLPAPVDRTPRASAVQGAQLPQLPSTPKFGDLMAFRLNALQQGMNMLPQVGQERQTRQAEVEGGADDLLNLDRFKVQNLVRQGDQTNLISRIDQARKQANTDRSADLGERRHKLNVLKELNADKTTFGDQLDELNDRREYLDNYWQYGDELGEAAFDLAEETGVPMPQLQDVLAEEIGDAGDFEPTPSNIEALKKRLRERVLEAR